MKLSQRIEQFRLEFGLTQEEAALKLGISRSTFARIEAGKEPGKLNRYKIEKKLAKLLTEQTAPAA